MPSSSRLPAPMPALPADCEKNLRILVVDDNEAIHADFRKILSPEAHGEALAAAEADLFGPGDPDAAAAAARPQFALSFAAQGSQALELVRAAVQTGQRFSLVFMDVRMPPGWNGLETTAKLWEVDPDLQVVICTAYSDKSWEEMMDSLGHPERVLILKKPFDTMEVMQLAHALTEKWSLLQAACRNTRELERTVSVRTRELVASNKRLEAETAGHKAAAERVREQAMLLEKARDAIMVRDLDGTITFWNHGAECLYGWSPAEAVGRTATELLYGGETSAEVIVARDEVLVKGSWTGELMQKTKDRRIVTVECRWTLVRDDLGRPKAVLGINSDVTEKKLLEAKFLRAQRLESIGTLAGGIAHDLNNILQPITLAMDVIRTQLPGTNRGMIDLVRDNAQRASSLVQQVLSFARGVDGRRALIQPNALVEEIASIVRETFPKTIEFRLCPVADGWPLLGDSTQLHQVLLNLCVNARDAMPAGGVLTLAVENRDVTEHDAALQPDAAAGRHVVLTVHDTGSGIPATLREKIWDPFFTTKEQGKGTGLGLATTLSIVRSHGGFITVHSEEGAGTTFRVFVPIGECVVAPADSSSAPGGMGDDPNDLRGREEVILVVDDEAPLLSVMRHSLQFFGYQVITATNGAEGVAAYAENAQEIKVVITDMVMPVMDGPTLIAEIKTLNPRVKVIATTGMSSAVSIQTIQRLGVDRIIAKPCDTKVILRALRDLISAPARK